MAPDLEGFRDHVLAAASRSPVPIMLLDTEEGLGALPLEGFWNERDWPWARTVLIPSVAAESGARMAATVIPTWAAEVGGRPVAGAARVHPERQERVVVYLIEAGPAGAEELWWARALRAGGEARVGEWERIEGEPQGEAVEPLRAAMRSLPEPG